MEWQPIKTAPQEDRLVLVWRVPPHYPNGLVKIQNAAFLTGEETHWMPLPEPPKNKPRPKPGR